MFIKIYTLPDCRPILRKRFTELTEKLSRIQSNITIARLDGVLGLTFTKNPDYSVKVFLRTVPAATHIQQMFTSVFTPEMTTWSPLCLCCFANWKIIVLFVFGLLESQASMLYFTHTKNYFTKVMSWHDSRNLLWDANAMLVPVTKYGKRMWRERA